MIELTPQQIAAYAEAAGKAAIDAEKHESPKTTVHVVENDGLLKGSLVVGIRCLNTPETVRLAAMCAMCTEWSNLVAQIETIDLNPEERAVLVTLSNTSDSATFMAARLRQAARSIGAAMMTINGADVALTYTTREQASQDLGQRYPGASALHHRIALHAMGVKDFISNTAGCDELLEHLDNPEQMPAASFVRLQAVAERMELQVARGEDGAPGFHATFTTLTHIIDRSPWMVAPGEGLVRKDSYSQRQQDGIRA